MLIIFTGRGKGKTTAALGQAMRAVGNGSRVLMVQFIKGPWISGEDSSAKRLSSNFKIVKKGKGFVGIANDDLPREIHIKSAEEGLAYAEEQALSKKWNILILDEVWNALSLGLLSSKAISDFIKKSVPYLDHLIMTGRDCPQEFIDQSDIVTEMKEIRHPFAQGIVGQRSVEY